jgi:cbb3-type cytochrome oxidase maturation protein
VAGGFLAAFVWAVQAGQFDDTVTPAVRVLLDDYRIAPVDRQTEDPVHVDDRSR